MAKTRIAPYDAPDLATPTIVETVAEDVAETVAQAALTAHELTPHGLTSHAIDGAFHSGTEVLPTQGQKNALAGTQGTPGATNQYVTTQDARMTDARTPVAHAHSDGDIPAGIARDSEVASAIGTHEAAGNPHPTYATDADLTTHASGPHGGGTWTTIIKPSDTGRTNNTVSADPHLVATLLANTNYVLYLQVFMLTNATADARYQLTFSGTTTRVRRQILRTATGDVAAHITVGTAFDAAPVVLSTTGLNPFVQERIILQVGASGGTFAFQWAQVTTNGSPCSVLEGSYLEYAVT